MVTSFIVFLCFFSSVKGYFADWSLLAGDRAPSCVYIPGNLTLCHNIGYTKMRLPNLLDHDTMQEVSQQASSWVPLLNIKCHPDTQLFLCSLFAPVCLEKAIYPCRSLCVKVKEGCESTMKAYGFPWPPMLDCDKFPVDNDMCIASQSENKSGNNRKKMQIAFKTIEEVIVDDSDAVQVSEDNNSISDKNSCSSQTCNTKPTFQNIVNHYCRADFVLKMRFRRVKNRMLSGRKVKTVFKTWQGTPTELKALRKPKLKLLRTDACCSKLISNRRKKQAYLVMGDKDGNDLVPTLIIPWNKDHEAIRRARRAFKKIDCKQSSALKFQRKSSKIRRKQNNGSNTKT